VITRDTSTSILKGSLSVSSFLTDLFSLFSLSNKENDSSLTKKSHCADFESFNEEKARGEKQFSGDCDLKKTKRGNNSD